jgi:threonylcarbamoyladenosine tRNA methylthiotransferase MtaB
MKRRHTREDAIAFCTSLRNLRPDVVFGADFIAGFPTETDAMFAETLDLLEACDLTHIHVFPFSARPGTPAARMPPVPGPVIKERARRLRDRAEDRLRLHLIKQVGRRLTVLTERGERARTEDFTTVRLPGSSRPGELFPVSITGHDECSLIGMPIESLQRLA